MKYFFLEKDIKEILENTSKFATKFSGKNILLTGGKGFIGRYLTEILLRYNKLLTSPMNLIVIDNYVTGKKPNEESS